MFKAHSLSVGCLWCTGSLFRVVMGGLRTLESLRKDGVLSVELELLLSRSGLNGRVLRFPFSLVTPLSLEFGAEYRPL